MQTIKEECLSVTEVADDVTIFRSQCTSHWERDDDGQRIWVEAEDCTCGAERVFQCAIAGKKYALVIPGCTARINANVGYIRQAIEEFSEYTGYKLIDGMDDLVQDCCGNKRGKFYEKIRQIQFGEYSPDDYELVKPIIEYGFNKKYYVARDVLRLIKSLNCFADKCEFCEKRGCDDTYCRQMSREKRGLFRYDEDVYNDGFVYFILGRMSNLIKIGYTAKNNRQRITDHKKDQWNEDLKMFAMIKGSQNLETNIHDDLCDHKVPGRRRDVFHYTAYVKNYIDNLLKICEHSPNETELVEWFNR